MTPRPSAQVDAVEGAAEGAEAVAVGGADEEEVVVAGPLGAAARSRGGNRRRSGPPSRPSKATGAGSWGTPSTQTARSLFSRRVVDALDQVPGERRDRRPPSRPRPTSASWCGGPGSRPIRRRRRSPRRATRRPGISTVPSIGTPARLRVQPQPSPSPLGQIDSIGSASPRRRSACRPGASISRRGPSRTTSRQPGRRVVRASSRPRSRSQRTQKALAGRADLGARRAEHQRLAVEADVAPALAQVAVAAQRHRAGRQGQVGRSVAGAAPGNRADRHPPQPNRPARVRPGALLSAAWPR